MRRWAALLLLAQVAVAEVHVVAVGVDAYDDTTYPALKYSSADAQALAAVFVVAGAPAANVTIVNSLETRAEMRPIREVVLRELREMAGRAKADDVAVFLFAGRGTDVGGQGYLLLQDANHERVAETGLTLAAVREALGGLKAKALVTLLDTSRGGGTGLLGPGLAQGLRVDGVPSATLLACEAGQQGWDVPELGHGAFAGCLLAGLTGAAAGGDGRVTLQGLAAHVTGMVSAWAAEIGWKQSPKLVGGEGAEVVLLARPLSSPEVPTVVVAADGSGKYRSVAEAVWRSQRGTRIVVLPGKYEGTVVVNRPVDIVGVGPRQSIILTSPTPPVVSWEAPTGSLYGVRIEGGKADEKAAYQGILVRSGQPVIEECEVEVQSTAEQSASILVGGAQSQPTFRRCLVTGAAPGQQKAGSIAFIAGAGGLVEECRFVEAYYSVACVGAGQPVFRKCELSERTLIQDCQAGFDECNLYTLTTVTGPAAAPVFRKCGFRTNWYALSFENGARGRIEECEFRGCDLHISSTQGAEPLVVKSRFFGGGTAFRAQTGSRGRFEDCRIDGVGVALRLYPGTAARYDRCQFSGLGAPSRVEGPTSRGIFVDCTQDGQPYTKLLTAEGEVELPAELRKFEPAKP